ncbi:sodium/hydrogen antiporter [Pancytospora philotis]|nr:sodium/hydrogen antiporter [Pancytospora philotis]
MEDLAKLTIFSALFILFYSMIAKRIHNTYHVPDPLVMILYGLLVGKSGLGVLRTHDVFSRSMISHISRIILCLQTMAVSLSLPSNYLWSNKQPLLYLIILGGFLKCGIIFVLLRLFSSLSTPTCWAIAASLSPTDPILSSSIVKGRFARTNVPIHLRTLLSAESGINDGLGIILLNISVEMLHSYHKIFSPSVCAERGRAAEFDEQAQTELVGMQSVQSITSYLSGAFPVPFAAVTRRFSPGLQDFLYFVRPLELLNTEPHAALGPHPCSASYVLTRLFSPLSKFIVSTVLVKVLFSLIAGYAIGYITRRVTQVCCAVELVRSEILIIHSFVLTFLGLALMDLIEGSELICIFFIGTALNAESWYSLEGSSQKMSEIVENLFSNTFFILLGSLLDLAAVPLRIFIVCCCIVAVSRPLSVLAISRLLPQLSGMREILFVGWFGPIGVGALYYCMLYDHTMHTFTVDFAMCIVFLSTVIHGLSVPVLCLCSKAWHGFVARRRRSG